jgi:hypothetical protein
MRTKEEEEEQQLQLDSLPGCFTASCLKPYSIDVHMRFEQSPKVCGYAEARIMKKE